MLKAREFS